MTGFKEEDKITNVPTVYCPMCAAELKTKIDHSLAVEHYCPGCNQRFKVFFRNLPYRRELTFAFIKEEKE